MNALMAAAAFGLIKGLATRGGRRRHLPIAAYTTGSAFGEFAEKNKGTLAPGMLADLVVLDTDITSVPPEKILATKVLRTVVGGKTVYEAR